MTCQLCHLHEPREDTITWPHPVCDRCWFELGEPGQPPSRLVTDCARLALQATPADVLAIATRMVVDDLASHPRDGLRAVRYRYPEATIQAAWELLCEREPNNERFEL
jgi:hypothetical protein